MTRIIHIDCPKQKQFTADCANDFEWMSVAGLFWLMGIHVSKALAAKRKKTELFCGNKRKF